MINPRQRHNHPQSYNYMLDGTPTESLKSTPELLLLLANMFHIAAPQRPMCKRRLPPTARNAGEPGHHRILQHIWGRASNPKPSRIPRTFQGGIGPRSKHAQLPRRVQHLKGLAMRLGDRKRRLVRLSTARAPVRRADRLRARHPQPASARLAPRGCRSDGRPNRGLTNSRLGTTLSAWARPTLARARPMCGVGSANHGRGSTRWAPPIWGRVQLRPFCLSLSGWSALGSPVADPMSDDLGESIRRRALEARIWTGRRLSGPESGDLSPRTRVEICPSTARSALDHEINRKRGSEQTEIVCVCACTVATHSESQAPLACCSGACR